MPSLESCFEIEGTLLDFSAVCPAHKTLQLSKVTSSVPSSAALWSAKSVYELAQGLQVAENQQLSSASRDLFFTNNSPLATTASYEKPTEDNLVRVMAKLVSGCNKRQSAFSTAAYKQLVYSSSAPQSEMKVRVAERVRAELDDKSVRNDAVIVLGGRNAQVLSDVLDATFVEAPTVLDLRAFFEKHHFQADVQRVFVWLDVENEHLQRDFAQQSQPVLALRDIVFAAAKWEHVKFVILPVPYAASLLPIFDLFMHEFNEINVNLPNVLWLNDAVRLDGARLAHSLGCNALITDFSSVDKTGRVTRKAVRAALRFIRQLKPSIVPQNVDLSDPLPQQQSTSSSSNLHGVRNGGVQKQHRGGNSSRGPNSSHGPSSSRGNNSQRGAPNKWGGGGSHGNSFDKRQRQGNRRN